MKKNKHIRDPRSPFFFPKISNIQSPNWGGGNLPQDFSEGPVLVHPRNKTRQKKKQMAKTKKKKKKKKAKKDTEVEGTDLTGT